MVELRAITKENLDEVLSLKKGNFGVKEIYNM